MFPASSRYLRRILLAAFCTAVFCFFTLSLNGRSSSWEAARVATPLEDQGGGGTALNPTTPAATSRPNILGSTEKQSPLKKKPAAGEPSTEKKPVVTKPRQNATFVSLARNSDVWEMADSIRQVEDRFNRDYNYDWVFLNDKPFDETFKRVTRALVSGNVKYGRVPREHWGFPEWIDQTKAAAVREEMKKKDIIYGDSINYRYMCRFQSGFFFQHPLLLDYEWYWRVEPGIKLYCNLPEDPFTTMVENGRKYGFVLSLFEYIETIPTLWNTVKEFVRAHPEYVAEDNSMGFLSDDDGSTYNRCHFWSNFEIGSLSFLRSPAYTDYFNHLDQSGGFFYERWGDAPVHSIAASLFLKRDEIHFFNEIGYYHTPFTHCPTGEKVRLKLGCHCNPKENFDWKGYSCTSKFFELNEMTKPDGYENQMD